MGKHGRKPRVSSLMNFGDHNKLALFKTTARQVGQTFYVSFDSSTFCSGVGSAYLILFHFISLCPLI